jgi:hypothetical protein
MIPSPVFEENIPSLKERQIVEELSSAGYKSK